MSTNNKDNKNFSQHDVLMVYLNESEDQLTNEILSSKQGCKQLESLQKDMQIIENNINDYTLDESQLDEDYGVDLWNKISGELSDELIKPTESNWLQRLYQQLQQPRFSGVGLIALFTVGITFYLLGQNSATIGQNPEHNLNSYNQQLLAQNVQLHLSQTAVFLTQVSNTNTQQNSPVLVNAAQSLLASNRIYKSAFANNDNKRLGDLLTELEQVLMEVSNGNTQNSQKYIQDYSSNELLFKVKSINQQLKLQPTTSI